MKLLGKALAKFLAGFLIVSASLFFSAGSFSYYNAWLFLGLLFIPILILGTILFFKNPALLQKRLDAKEDEQTQKTVVALSGILFFFGFSVAGLDYRFKWSEIPLWAIIAASVILLLSYALYAEVMRENAHLSRTVKVEENQAIIDTGLYGIVRHPMYAVTIWLFLAIPVILGSLWAILCFIPYIPIIITRILNEEKLLTTALQGYADYKKRVKYRLIPFIW